MFQKYSAALPHLRCMQVGFHLLEIIKGKLLNSDGEELTEEALKEKIIGIYFSAHWVSWSLLLWYVSRKEACQRIFLCFFIKTLSWLMYFHVSFIIAVTMFQWFRISVFCFPHSTFVQENRHGYSVLTTLIIKHCCRIFLGPPSTYSSMESITENRLYCIIGTSCFDFVSLLHQRNTTTTKISYCIS